MNSKIYKIILLIAITAIICFSATTHDERNRYKIPPPGWEIVEDGKGNFGAKHADSGHVISKRCGDPLKSRQAAIDRAWRQWVFKYELVMEEGKKGPKPEVEWKPSNP